MNLLLHYMVECINFKNSNDYSNIAIINNIENSWKNICLLENALLCFVGLIHYNFI